MPLPGPGLERCRAPPPPRRGAVSEPEPSWRRAAAVACLQAVVVRCTQRQELRVTDHGSTATTRTCHSRSAAGAVPGSQPLPPLLPLPPLPPPQPPRHASSAALRRFSAAGAGAGAGAGAAASPADGDGCDCGGRRRRFQRRRDRLQRVPGAASAGHQERRRRNPPQLPGPAR